MAKEAIEKVQKAESEAADIVTNAETEAAELLAKAGTDADARLKAAEEEETRNLLDAVAAAKAETENSFEDFKKEVSEKCNSRREELLAGRERIIGRIIEAVKKG